MDEIKNVGAYLKRVSEKYDKEKSLTEILTSFRVLTSEYQKFNESDDKIVYSNSEYDKCTDGEKELFENDQLVTFESAVTNSIYDRVGQMYSWKSVYELIKDPIYKNTEKINRRVIFSSMTPNRPIGESGFDTWNGLQIIDLDIHDAGIADLLKPVIFDELKKYHWFLGVCKSASGKSLHVWTKITPISVKHDNKKVEYLCNFRHKFSYIYIVLSRYADKFGYTKDQIEEFMDMAMAKPQQGIFITSDDSAMMSTNFIDQRLDVNFEPAFEQGVESIDWISHPALKGIFSKLEWFNNDVFDKQANVELSDVSNVNDRDASKNVKKHYKHSQRWQLANTLTNIYGYEKGLQYMCEICKSTPFKELKGDVKTAQIHQKPISIWAIKELNNYHGFNIKFNDAQSIYLEQQKAIDEMNSIELSKQSTGLEQISQLVTFNIRSDQYLSDIKDDIISNLSHITLLEAGAGYGKTEMIKALKAKTCLILPFTSTIKSKIEKSEVTADWLYYYGNKRPTLDALLGNHNMSMTIDKFSRLNVMELDQAGFEYIVIDESHLLFTSSYRDVMAPTIQRLANCKAKIIMMTGTPTGELTFFPGIKHIKVIKEDKRIKDFEVHFCPSPTEQMIEMCKMMAEDIKAGKKVLYPTNNGNLYYEEIRGIIQQYLDKLEFGRPLNSFYYKKSNYGDESMDDINYDKTIGCNDLIMCTTYLSVGVDICDKYAFSVYFNETWIPQDIEQFANRLRNNDLYVKMFLPKVDEAGVPINYYFTHNLDLSFNKEDLLLARDLIRTCNDMIERNNEEAKSNPLVQSLIAANKYLKYDENACKYYIDETMYKLKVFEDRYSDYNKQLKVLLEGIKYYGYTISQVDHTEQVSEDRKLEIDQYLRSCRTRKYNENTNKTFAFIHKINDNNIDIYREILKGNLDILRGKDDLNKKTREENNLYVDDIEIVERNAPIILSLYKYYDIPTIEKIYQYCVDEKQNRINFTKLERIRRFINVVNSIKKKRLDFPIYKFVSDAKKYALENPVVKKTEVDSWLAGYAATYANGVRDVVATDVAFLTMVFDHLSELWKVVITQSRPKDGVVQLSPFELLWEVKDSLDTVYGGNITKEFFMQELIDEMKEDEPAEATKPTLTIDVDETLPEIEKTSKMSYEAVEPELAKVVSKDFDYYKYSENDGSNERFMEKQKNTSTLRDTIFDSLESDAPLEDNKEEEKDLFS